MTDVHLVIVNYNHGEDTLALLAGVFKEQKECPFRVEITVVDNSQNIDGVEQRLQKEYPTVRYINPQANLGFGKATNVGFQSHEARYYFALNPDCLFVEGQKTIERLVTYMDTHPKIGAIGPQVRNFDNSIQYACYRFDLPSICVKPLRHLRFHERFRSIERLVDHLQMRDFSHDRTQPVDWVMGSAIFVRAETVKEVGWFDERYFMYLEDADWCRSMWEKGWPVYYVHDIVILHRHGRGSSKVPGVFTALIKNSLARAHVKSWCQYLWKWRGTFRHYVHN